MIIYGHTSLPSGRQQAGFTLIELILCIVIIGILAAISVPHFMEMRSTTNKQSFVQIHNAISIASRHNAMLYQAKLPGGFAVQEPNVCTLALIQRFVEEPLPPTFAVKFYAAGYNYSCDPSKPVGTMATCVIGLGAGDGTTSGANIDIPCTL